MKLKSTIVLMVFMLSLMSAFAEEKRFSIPIGDSPQKGPNDAPVTLIEFLDFQ